jgi:hypothetical protein
MSIKKVWGGVPHLNHFPIDAYEEVDFSQPRSYNIKWGN